MTDQSADERYPEPEGDEVPGPLYTVVEALRDADATHYEKAIACLGAARTEYGYAVEDGEIDSGPGGVVPDFIGWARHHLGLLDEVLEELDAGR